VCEVAKRAEHRRTLATAILYEGSNLGEGSNAVLEGPVDAPAFFFFLEPPVAGKPLPLRTDFGFVDTIDEDAHHSRHRCRLDELE
jgi:hypothetical protein